MCLQNWNMKNNIDASKLKTEYEYFQEEENNQCQDY